MKQYRHIPSLFVTVISLLCTFNADAITSSELLTTSDKAEVLFLTSVADPNSEAYLTVFDHDVLIKIQFSSGVSLEDEIAAEFTNEGGASGEYTLNQVVNAINAQAQSITGDDNYDMAGVKQNTDGTYSLRLRSRYTAEHTAVLLYGNATAGQDARIEGVFGDVSCPEDDSFWAVNAMMYHAYQKVCGHYFGDRQCMEHLAETFTFSIPQETIYSDPYLQVFDEDVKIVIEFTDSSTFNHEEIAVVFSNEGGSGGVYTLLEVIDIMNAASQNLGPGKNYDMAKLVSVYDMDCLCTVLTMEITSLGASDAAAIRYGNAAAGFDARIEGVFGDASCADDDSFTDVDSTLHTASSTCGFYLSLTLGEFATLAAAWGSDPSSDNWNYNCDYDCSDRIDEGDLMILTRDWGTFIDY